MALVQSASNNGYGVTTVSVTLNGTVAGNLAVMTVTNVQGSTTACTPPAGWSTAIAPAGVTNGAFGAPFATGAAIFYKENLAGGTLTATPGLQSGSAADVTISEWSGYATSSSIDKTASNSATTGTSGNTGTTAATTVANELVIAVLAEGGLNSSGANGITTPASSGYTSLYTTQNGNQRTPTQVSYKEVTGTGTQTASWTWTSPSEYQAVIATFKAAAAGGRLFRSNPSAQLSGLGCGGPFFQNPLQ